MKDKIGKLIDELVSEALQNSKTYEEAIQFLSKNIPWDSLGKEITKVAQDKIQNLALGREIKIVDHANEQKPTKFNSEISTHDILTVEIPGKILTKNDIGKMKITINIDISNTNILLHKKVSILKNVIDSLKKEYQNSDTLEINVKM